MLNIYSDNYPNKSYTDNKKEFWYLLVRQDALKSFRSRLKWELKNLYFK